MNKTELIYRTALSYASYKGKESNITDDLLKNMFNDLCLLSDEYTFDYKQELKNILNKEGKTITKERRNNMNKYTLTQILEAWIAAYGENMDEEYPGFIQRLQEEKNEHLGEAKLMEEKEKNESKRTS